METRTQKGQTTNRTGGLALIRSAYPALAPAEQRVADYCLANPEKVIYLSVTQLASICNVGESTVIRFCQASGFAGYQDLKLNLAVDTASSAEPLVSNLSANDSLSSLIEKVTYLNTCALKDTASIMNANALEKAIDAISSARKVEFYGVGASGITALDAKYKFIRIGINCDAPQDGHIQAMSAANLGSGDVAVGISHSGSTRDTVDSVRIAKQNGATVICITDISVSPITNVADIVLLTSSAESPLQSGALRSKIAQVHVLDLLYTGVVLKLGKKAEKATERTARAVVDKLY